MNTITKMQLTEIEIPLAGETLWPSALCDGNWYAILPDAIRNSYYLYNRYLGEVNIPSELVPQIEALFKELNARKPHLAEMGKAILWEAWLDLHNCQN